MAIASYVVFTSRDLMTKAPTPDRKDTVLVTCPVPWWPGHVEQDELGL